MQTTSNAKREKISTKRLPRIIRACVLHHIVKGENFEYNERRIEFNSDPRLSLLGYSDADTYMSFLYALSEGITITGVKGKTRLLCDLYDPNNDEYTQTHFVANPFDLVAESVLEKHVPWLLELRSQIIPKTPAVEPTDSDESYNHELYNGIESEFAPGEWFTLAEAAKSLDVKEVFILNRRLKEMHVAGKLDWITSHEDIPAKFRLLAGEQIERSNDDPSLNKELMIARRAIQDLTRRNLALSKNRAMLTSTNKAFGTNYAASVKEITRLKAVISKANGRHAKEIQKLQEEIDKLETKRKK